jgi:hypothetical protein
MSRLIVRTWMRPVLRSKSQAFNRRDRRREHGENEMCWWLTLMGTW